MTSRGFSSVVAGLAGFGLVGVGVVLHRAYGLERRLAWNVVAALGVVVAAEILWLVVGRFSRPAAGLVVLGVALTFLPLARAGVRSGLPTGRAGWLRVGGAVVMTVLLAALVGVFVVGLFPAELAREDAFTNVLGHYLGLVYGAVIAGWGYRYWSVPAGRGPGNRRS